MIMFKMITMFGRIALSSIRLFLSLFIHETLTLSLSLETHLQILSSSSLSSPLSFSVSFPSLLYCLISIHSPALRGVLSADRLPLPMRRQSDFHVNGVRMSFSSEAAEKMNSWRLPRGTTPGLHSHRIPMQLSHNGPSVKIALFGFLSV